MRIIDDVTYGKTSDREMELILSIGEFLANWIEKHKIDRSELICAISNIYEESLSDLAYMFYYMVNECKSVIEQLLVSTIS